MMQNLQFAWTMTVQIWSINLCVSELCNDTPLLGKILAIRSAATLMQLMDMLHHLSLSES